MQDFDCTLITCFEYITVIVYFRTTHLFHTTSMNTRLYPSIIFIRDTSNISVISESNEMISIGYQLGKVTDSILHRIWKAGRYLFIAFK